MNSDIEIFKMSKSVRIFIQIVGALLMVACTGGLLLGIGLLVLGTAFAGFSSTFFFEVCLVYLALPFLLTGFALYRAEIISIYLLLLGIYNAIFIWFIVNISSLAIFNIAALINVIIYLYVLKARKVEKSGKRYKSPAIIVLVCLIVLVLCKNFGIGIFK